MNPEIQLLVRDSQCDLCPMSADLTERDVCITASGPASATIMVVSKTPLSGKAMGEIKTYLDRAGINPDFVVFTAAAKCRTWELEPTKTALKACRTYLDAEIERANPKYILALGNEAMYSLVGKSGIMKYRGQVFE